MGESHYFCCRCGIVLTGFSVEPTVCPKCGGVQIENIGQEGEYNLRHVRKEHRAPFHPEKYFKNPN